MQWVRQRRRSGGIGEPATETGELEGHSPRRGMKGRVVGARAGWELGNVGRELSSQPGTV